MSNSVRIITTNGRWVQSYYEHSLIHWVPMSMVKIWEEVGPKALTPALVKATARAVELCDLIGWHPNVRMVRLPLTPDQCETHSALMTERCAQHKERKSGYFGHGMPWQVAEALASVEIERNLATTHQELFVAMPLVNWVTREGAAVLYKPEQAHALIEKAQWAMELARVLPKAMDVAKASGVKLHEWMMPLPQGIGTGTRDLARAQAQLFNAAQAYEQKRGFAVYVNIENGGRGFMDPSRRVRNDLAEACLFPTLEAAKHLAIRSHGMAYVVEVDMSAVAYHAVNGAPPSDDLSKVIASRERKDLERVLDSARVEELEAALVRARTALAEKGDPAPCRSEPAPRRARL